MNQGALSLTGLRVGIFSQILLVLTEFDESSQTYNTRQEDIVNIFLRAAQLEAQVTESSGNPVTSAAVFAHVASLLLQYRRNDVDIPMAEVSGLLHHLQTTYRPLTNVTFPHVVSNTSISYDGGTDLKSKIQALQHDISQNSDAIHRLAFTLAGENMVQTETSWTDYLAKPMSTLLQSSVFQAGKHAHLYSASNLNSMYYNLPNHYYVHPSETSRILGADGRPDTTWAMPSGNNIFMRYVFRRKTLTSSILNAGVIPLADIKNYDMGHVYECDQEMRGQASILLGKRNSPWEGKFRVKHITSYDGNLPASFPDNLVHVLHTTPILELDSVAGLFHVHINCPSLSINGIAVVPGPHGTSTNTHHHHVTEHHQHHTIVRRHRHAHFDVNTDQHFHYTAPSRTVINRNTQHIIQTFQDQTVLQTVQRNIKSTRVVPSQFFTEFNQNLSRMTWGSIRGKPDLDALYASPQDVIDAVSDKLDVTQVNQAIDTKLTNYTNTNPGDFVTNDALTSALSGYLQAGHQHDFQNDSRYHEKTVADNRFTLQSDHDNHVGAVSNALAGVSNALAVRPTNVQIQNAYYERYAAGRDKAATTYNATEIDTQLATMVGDRITVGGLFIALRNYAVVSEEFSNGLRLAWRDSADNPHDMIVVKLQTFQDLATRVAQLEQQQGTLFNQSSATDTAVTAAQSQISIVNNFAQAALQRLTAAGL